MPLYNKVNLPARPLDLVNGYESTFGQYMGAKTSEAWQFNPTTVLSNMGKALELRYGEDVASNAEEGGLTGGYDAVKVDKPEFMPIEAQKDYIKSEGLEGHLKPDQYYTKDELDFHISLKRDELENAMTIEQAPDWMAPFGFMAGLGVSMLDPINLATAYVPVMSQARTLNMLAGASFLKSETQGLLGRAGVRMGVGALSGAAGAAMVEPIIATGRNFLQQEHDFTTSLLNIGFGAALGATLHPVSGAVGDWLRARRGQGQPWAFAPKTRSTEVLRKELEQEIAEARIGDIDYDSMTPAERKIAEKLEAQKREQARVDSEAYSMMIRRDAWFLQKQPEEIHENYKIRIVNEEKYAARAEASERTLVNEISREFSETGNDNTAVARPVADVNNVNPETSVAQETQAAASNAVQAAGRDTAENTSQGGTQSAASNTAPNATPGTIKVDVPVSNVVETSPDGQSLVRGRQTTILLGDGKEDAAHYEVVELDSLITSHKPGEQFRENEKYPKDVQERPYHSDANEQAKVIKNAAELQPRYLITDNPDAVNGPPIITNGRVVLGGNSRVMSLLFAAENHANKMADYRAALEKAVNYYGIDPATLGKFKQPVLVRVVDKEMNDGQMAVYSNLYNQSQTHKLSTMAEGVSRAKSVTAKTLDILVNFFKQDEKFSTLYQFLDRRAAFDFVEGLFHDGVITKTERSRYISKNKNGKEELNFEGKNFVESIMRGLIVKDFDILLDSDKGIIDKIDKAIPSFLRLKQLGDNWDLANVVTRAMALINVAKRVNDAKTLYDNVLITVQRERLNGNKINPATEAMALTLAGASTKELRMRLGVMAEGAERVENQAGSMLGLKKPINQAKAEVFIDAFFKPIAMVDNRLIARLDPMSNPEHEAIMYVYVKGGEEHSVQKAMQNLRAAMDRTTDPEKLANLEERKRQILRLDGSKIDVYGSDIGQSISYGIDDVLYQMLGERGVARLDQARNATVRMDNLGVARDMENSGRDAASIKMATGWERGADGKWRYEVPDGRIVAEAKLERKTAQGDDDFVYHTTRLGDIYDAPELYAAYPELKDMEIVFQPMERGVHGMFDGERIILSDDFTTTRQQRNADQIAEIEKTPEYQKYQQELEATDNIDDPIKAEQEFDRIEAEWQNTELGAKYTELLNTNKLEVVSTGKVREDMLPSLIHEIQHAIQEKEGFARGSSNIDKNYRNLAGEVEARNVQRRADMTPEERRASLARETEDVAREDQIYLKDGLDAAMMAEESGKSADQLLAEDMEAWGKTVDNIVAAGRVPSSSVQMLRQTPLVMQLLGADTQTGKTAAKGGIYMAPHVFDGKHPNITPEMWKQIPEAMADPIAIFDSDNPINRANGDIVFMLDIKDANGATVIVPVAMNRIVDKPDVMVNITKSAYSKERNGVPANLWFKNQAQKNIRYVNRQKMKRWQASAGVYFPFTLLHNASDNIVYTDADLVNFNNKQRLKQDSPQGGHRASVTFGVDDLFALIKISKNADASSVMHELFHVHRRMWEQMYNDPSVSPAVKERYRRACEFVGAEPGKEWTVAQEEKFARAGERYLLEGESPHPSMDGVMENFKQWLYAIYSDADRAGLEISDSMRNVFAGMLGTAELGDLNFRYSMGRMLQYEPEDGIDTNVDMPPAGRQSDRTGTNTGTNTVTNAADGAANGTDRAAVQALEDYAADATARADEAFEALADNPAAQETIRAEYEAEMAAADTVIVDAQREIEISRAAAECVMRG